MMYLLFLACVLIEPPASQELPIAKAEAPPAKEAVCSCSKGCVCAFPACQCLDNFGEPQRCDNAKCGCAQRPKKAEHAYRWVRGDALDQIHLYDGAKQVGTWRYDKKLYYPFDGEKWSDPFVYPEGRLPHGAPKPPAKDPNYKGKGNPPAMPVPSQSFTPSVRVRSC